MLSGRAALHSKRGTASSSKRGTDYASSRRKYSKQQNKVDDNMRDLLKDFVRSLSDLIRNYKFSVSNL